MGTKRGRALIDWLRHRLGFSVRGEYPTRKDYWERSYKRAENRVASEWCGLGYRDFEKYSYRTENNDLKYSGLAEDISFEAKTLILGSGTSLLGADMYQAGWRDLTQLDFASTAQLFTIPDKIPFIRGDARFLRQYFQQNSFDAIIDKGTIDSIYLSAAPNSTSYLERILDGAAYITRKSSGNFLFFSLSKPEYLLPSLHTFRTTEPWQWNRLQVRSLDSIFLYYLPRSSRPYRRPLPPFDDNLTFDVLEENSKVED
mmetsp:Transcript_19108/g.24789  ORF Transcript_19108/g.24789 Transcript_19108/m.24789 type:complete len:257 (-) Transcript_19108:65-835(-)